MPSRGMNHSTNSHAMVLDGCRLSINTLSMTINTIKV